MNLNLIPSQLADFGMPICDRGRTASVRAYRGVTFAAVKGAFPGPSAWSPPN